MNTSQVIRLIIYVIILIFFKEIISDWEHFKAGIITAIGYY